MQKSKQKDIIGDYEFMSKLLSRPIRREPLSCKQIVSIKCKVSLLKKGFLEKPISLRMTDVLGVFSTTN
jgi:hypothetical protein